MTKSKGILAKKRGEGGKKAQLSNIAILNMWRARSPQMFIEIDKILNGRNENAKVAVIKMGMGKLIADLKSSELNVGEGVIFKFEIVQDNTLRDANRKDTTTNKTLPETTGDIQLPSKV